MAILRILTYPDPRLKTVAKPVNDFKENKNTPPIAALMINPEIIKTEGEVQEQEGCMSVYPSEILATVTRPACTHMRGFDRHGNTIEFIREGYLAKLFIHELDHLNGKLYIDHLKPLKRTMVNKKIKKIRQKQDK